MAKGWDSGNRWGTSRLQCASPPGTGVTGGAGTDGESGVPCCEGFVPNVFTCLGPQNVPTTLPTVALGIVNFCMEFWFCWRVYLDPNPDYTLTGGMQVGYFYTAPNTVDASVVACGVTFWQQDGGYHVTYNQADGPPGAVGSGLQPVGPGWHHIAVNFNRTGNMEWFLDGTSQGTALINAANAGTQWFNPGTSSTTVWAGSYPTLRQPGAVAIGPIAAHSGLLTTAQIQNSLRGKRVQLLGTTQIYYDWRRLVGQANWECDLANIGIISTMPSLPVIAPMGVDGTVVIPDLSGNGNDWVLPTAEVYSPPVAPDYDTAAQVGFMADPWWYS